MGIFLGTQAIYPSGIEKVYVGTQLVYQKVRESYTTLTISTAGSYTLSLSKEDTKETKIYVNDNLVATSTTEGVQDIPITTTNQNDIVKIENNGNWFFYSYALGSSENNLNLVNVDLSNEHNMTSTGIQSFEDCSNLTSIIIPNSVTNIGSGSFRNCDGLTSITIPSTVTSIGLSAFSGCDGLTSITIPNTVTSIGTYAFNSCRNLKNVIFEENSRLTSIETGVFTYCSKLTSITIPASVSSIGNSAFSNCESLTSITIPNSVTSIGQQAFDMCADLTSLTLGSGVTTIGQQAFRGTGLKTLTIPSTVTDIKNNAFSQTSKLLTTYIYTTSSSTKITSAANAWFYSANTSMVIHAPSSLNATTSQNAYGSRWNSKNIVNTKFTTYYDL